MRKHKISNDDKFNQKTDFDIYVENCNLGFTDFDMVWEYRGTHLIIGELKFGETPLKQGQRAAMEAIYHTYAKAGKKCLLIHLTHNNEGEIVKLSECVAVAFYDGNKWRSRDALPILDVLKKTARRWNLEINFVVD